MNPQTHMQKFGRAYLIGALFVFVQVLSAIVGEFGGMKPEEIASMTHFEWFTHWCAVGVSAGTVVLAFLNKSAQATPPTQPSS